MLYVPLYFDNSFNIRMTFYEYPFNSNVLVILCLVNIKIKAIGRFLSEGNDNVQSTS